MTDRSAPAPSSRFASRLLWSLCIVLVCAASAFAEDAPAGGYATKIFVNGTVVTVDPEHPQVAALAVGANGTILAVGSEADVRKFERKGFTEVVDLDHKTLMPGFVEPHTHSVMTAFNANNPVMLNLSSFNKKPMKIAEIQKALQEAMKQPPIDGLVAEGGWLLAFGVDPARTDPFMDSLDAKKLDEVSKTVPIFVLNQSGHLAYVNTLAIELAKIQDETDPDGGVYVRKDGKLTGVLEEAPAYAPFQALVGKSATGQWFNTSRQLAALKTTYNQFAEAGITTATEISLGIVTGKINAEYELLKTMTKDTPVRIRAYVSASVVTDKQPVPMTPNGQQEKSPDLDLDLLKVIGIKFVADGSTQGLSASLLNKYEYPLNTTNTGTLNYPNKDCKPTDEACICKRNDALVTPAKSFMKEGWQLAIHSNGDCSTRQVLQVYEELLGDNPDQKAREAFAARRFRIEHLTVTDEHQLNKIAALGLSPSMTNGHVYFWGYAFGDQKTEILGWPRTERLDPAKSLLVRDVRFSFNSDSPITPAAPLRYISTAVTREWQQKPSAKLAINDNQGISVDAAIKAVTIDAAYQLFLENEIGSLKLHKRADLLILEKNPRTTAPADIMGIRVLATYLGGNQKYPTPAPAYGSLQNATNKEYRCDQATHLSKTYRPADCLMRFVRNANGSYGIQNMGNHEYFQSHIGTMSGSADSIKQEWDIIGTNGRYTIQNRSNHEYMTRSASSLSSTAGPDEYWNIEERPAPELASAGSSR
jgi:predicted amidohydrolase YtcJ